MKSTGKIVLIVFCILQATKCTHAQKSQIMAEKEEESIAGVIISEDIKVEATPVLVAIIENADFQNLDTEDFQTESGVITPIDEVNATVANSTPIAEFPMQDPKCDLEINVDNNHAIDTTDEIANTDTTEDATEAQPIDTTTMMLASTTKTTAKLCTTVGNFPHESDCHLYYTCSSTATVGQFNLLEQSCASKTAFNADYGRCMRDSFYCADGIKCEQAGTFADAQSNSSYYWCIGRYIGGFHKYHVQCATGQVFMPQLGRCFVDINHLQNFPPNFDINSEEPGDENAIKAELKQIKTEEKAQMKQQRLKEKLEKKLQKELAKKATKDAKKEAKLQNSSKEDESYVCIQEGNFASTLNSRHYYLCTTINGKFKAVGMNCPAGYNFDQKSSACILLNTTKDDE